MIRLDIQQAIGGLIMYGSHKLEIIFTAKGIYKSREYSRINVIV